MKAVFEKATARLHQLADIEAKTIILSVKKEKRADTWKTQIAEAVPLFHLAQHTTVVSSKYELSLKIKDAFPD